MNKIDDAIQQLLIFGKNFFKTFFNVLFRPYEFFDDVINGKKDKEVTRVNSLTYLLLSTFVFVFTINAKRLSLLIFKESRFQFDQYGSFFFDYFEKSYNCFNALIHLQFDEYFKYLLSLKQPFFKFQLYNAPIQNITTSLFSISFEKLILLTLPIVVSIYLFSKLLSYLLIDKSIRKSFTEIISYINSTIFLYYFFIFLLLIFYTKVVYSFISIENISTIIILSSLFWIPVIIISVYFLINAFIAVKKILDIPKINRRFNFLVIISVFGLILLYYTIAKKQKDFDTAFDPLKQKSIGISFLKNNDDTFFSITENPGIKGIEFSNFQLTDTATVTDSSRIFKVDVLITNKSDELLFLHPGFSAFMFVSKSPLIKVNQNLFVKSLKDSTFNNSYNPEFEKRIILNPGETQLLNLQCFMDNKFYNDLNSVLSDEYIKDYRIKASIKLNFLTQNSDITDQSAWEEFNISGFYPDTTGTKNFEIQQKQTSGGGGG
ncbi:MAG TPA: hypothetical protein PKD83_04415 [Ignavibacteria bacterium]|nr:hypothetical protein [Ignavibacteria bacterium]